MRSRVTRAGAIHSAGRNTATTVSQENVAKTRAFIVNYNRRDFDAAMEAFHPEIEWVLPALQEADSCRGPEEIRRFWEGLDETFDELRLDPQEFVDRGDRVAVRLRYFGRGKGSGAQLDEEMYHQVTTFRGEEIVRFEYFTEWAQALEAAGGPPVRRARAADAQAIGAVFDAAVSHGWTFLGERARRPLFEPHKWDELVAAHAPPDALLVATGDGDEVIGFSAVHSEDGELFLLFVDPAHAGRGVGHTLLEAAHDVLRGAGHREAFLFTEERNERSLAVYAAAGYRPDGTQRESDLDGIPLREVRLVKQL